MNEYIERETLIDWLKKAGRFLKCEEEHKRVTRIIGKIIEHIEKTPAADVAEVVRCKDCVFGKHIEDSGNYKCTTFNGRFGVVKPEDFCSYGERRFDSK